jgi:exonuclease I
MRACYALRPEGINWPENDEGLPSFRLEHLTVANGIEHRTPTTRWPTFTPPSPWRSW